MKKKPKINRGKLRQLLAKKFHEETWTGVEDLTTYLKKNQDELIDYEN